MKKDYKDIVSFGFIGVLYIFAVIKATLVPMHVPVTAWGMLLFALGSFLFYVFLDTRIGRILFLSGIAGGVLYIGYMVINRGTGVLPTVFEPVSYLMQVMAQVGMGYYNEPYADIWLLRGIGVYSLLVAMPIYYFLVRFFRFYVLIIPGLAFFMTVWGINRHIDKFSFYVFIVVAIVCYIRHVFLQHRKHNRDFNMPASNNRSILIYFIPIAVMIILLSSLIPVNPRPIQWPWMDEKINRLWWDLEQKFSIDRYDSFSLANTGFGDPSRLGGPVRPDNTPIMVVEAPTRVYLRGAVYDRYNGIGWEISEQEPVDFMDDRVYDHQELRFGWKTAVNLTHSKVGFIDLEELSEINDTEEYIQFLKHQQMPSELSRLYPEKVIEVTHLNVRTKTLFTPLKLFIPITGLASNGYVLEEGFGGIFRAQRRLAGDSRYQVNYIQPGYGMRRLEDYFEISRPGLYNRFIEDTLRFLNDLEEDKVQNVEIARQEVENVLQIYEQLHEHRNDIYAQYTKIPETIPDRVIQLANQISQRPSSTYRKVKVLEDFLRENYDYTLSPDYPPMEKDFVDYFLFDGKEGYCSYFASALCIMTRAIGVPARYVEGFVLPEEPDSNGYYHVTNQNAHAWTEVYLEGVGWVTFEPTAPFAGAMNYYISLNENSGQAGYYDEIPEFDEAYYRGQYTGITERELNMFGQEEMTTGTFSLVLMAIVVIAVFINWLFVLGRWGVFHLMSPVKSVPLAYYYLVSLLKQSGCGVNIGETPKDFARRVDLRYQFVHMSMDEMVELYYRVRFGGHGLDKKNIKRLFRFVQEVKTKSGRNMYLIKRVVFRGFLFQG